MSHALLVQRIHKSSELFTHSSIIKLLLQVQVVQTLEKPLTVKVRSHIPGSAAKL